jgi:hypothetical protein
MLTFLSTFFAWAIKNQMITGFLTLVGSKIYLLIEDYIKKKYFPQPQIVEIKECNHKITKKKVAKKENIHLGYIILFSILGLLGIYIFFTYQQFPY